MTRPERVLALDLAGTPALGLVSEPDATTQAKKPAAKVGVLVLVGGPQYRVGAHRQFVLLARHLAEAGYPCLRFDHRGVGDSVAALQSFEALDADVSAGIDALLQARPELQGVVLWGLCDGAAAALLHARRVADPRVRGLVLLNPWVRTPQGQAKARVQHYYRDRLRDPAFWRKLLGGGVGLTALRGWLAARRLSSEKAAPALGFQLLMAEAWRRFEGPVLLQLSGQDQTAQEFEAADTVFDAWRGWRERPALTLQRFAAADHTFSSRSELEASLAGLSAWLDQNFAVTPP